MPLKTKPQFCAQGVVLFLLVLVLNSWGIYAQEYSKLTTKGNELFEEQKYEKALKVYLKQEKKEDFNDWTYLQIARCYERLNNYLQAAYFYDQLFYKSSDVDPIVFLEYGAVLMKLERPEEARSYFTSYNNLFESNDLRALRYIESIEDYDKYFKDSAFIQLTGLEINSSGSELSPVIYQEKLIYLSNEKYFESEPATFDIYSASSFTDKSSHKKVSGTNTSKSILEGITIANITGEFIYCIYNPVDKTTQVNRAFIEEGGESLSKSDEISFGSFEGRIAYPTVNATGSKIIFASDRRGGTGGWDLYISYRNSYGYSEPELLPGFINTLGNELYPYLLNDTILFFASDGHGGVGGLDLFSIDLNRPAALPDNPGYPVNSVYDEMGLCVSADGKIGYLVSERSEKEKFADIYQFQLEKIRAWGEVTDKETGENLKNVAVDITKEGETSSQFSLADNGRFSVTGAPGDAYNVSVWREGYELDKFYVNTEDAQVLGLYEIDMGKFPILKTDEIQQPPVPEPEPIAVVEESEPEPEPEITTPVVPIPEPEPEIAEEVIPEPEPEIIEEVIPEPEPVQEVETVIVPDRTPATEIRFRLQIAAARRQLTHAELRKIYDGPREIFMFTEDQWYKYAIGEFDSYFEANEIRKQCGVSNAFIAAYKQDNKLPLMTAIEKVHVETAPTQELTSKQNVNTVDQITVLYPLNSYQPNDSEMNKLHKLLSELQADPELKVEIDGHTDKLGSKAYNIGLANARANYVKSFLVLKGINQSRIHITAYGESRLREYCSGDCTPQIHQANRRVEIVTYKD